MSKVWRSRVGGPLARYADGFRLELARLGYTPGSAEIQVWWMGRLSRWMALEGVEIHELDERSVAQFLAVDESGRRRMPTVRTLAPLLGWLRDQRLVPPAATMWPTPIDELLGRYRRWLVDERGLAERTIGRYEATARRFLEQRASAVGGGDGTEGLNGADVTAFLLRECTRGLAVGSAKGRVGELRCLLRFLHVEGVTPMALAAAVPPVAGWREVGLPPTLATSDVAAVVDSCDRTTPTGVRDFAILMLLARLGLRAAEVAGLELDGIDWRAGEIVVCGKGRRDDRLPLPADVGEALAAYLTKARPPATCRNVFVTRHAPLRPMHPNTIGRVVLSACQRAGVPPVRSHRLRHALATEMLRQGVVLTEISQVLRHRDLATTATYAKVDLVWLRQVAQPWPGAAR